MSTAARSGPGKVPEPLPLRFLRFLPGETWQVRFLADGLLGLLTHWDKRQSRPCLGKECPTGLHQQPSYWKGYAPVLVWQARSKNWLPTVLEVTEHLELDLRGRRLRGEEWKLTRDEQTGKHKTPVMGEHIQTLEKVPSAFEIKPCLIHLYHSTDLVFGAKNKLPARSMIEATEGPPPLEAGPADGLPPDEHQRRLDVWNRFRNRRNGNGSGDEHGNSNGNGTH